MNYRQTQKHCGRVREREKEGERGKENESMNVTIVVHTVAFEMLLVLSLIVFYLRRVLP